MVGIKGRCTTTVGDVGSGGDMGGVKEGGVEVNT